MQASSTSIRLGAFPFRRKTMANLIYACWRDPMEALDEASLKRVADRIAPSGAWNYPHQMVVNESDCLCLTGPVGAAKSKGTSAHLGAFEGRWPEWDVPGSALPDGTFALVRSNNAVAEICSDFAGSRTLWYAQTEKHFIASTSQRALVCLLEGFDLNKSAVAWFLSSGSLGPSDAWDKRLSRLPRGGRLALDRVSWRVDLQTPSDDFHPRKMQASDCRHALMGILREAIQGFDFTSGNWALPLSGGYDSRFLLTSLYESGLRPATMTWGLADSLTQPGNDAFIAEKLAKHYGLPHDYLLTEISGDPPEQVVDAFLSASGGTTDQLYPYLDGLRMWSSFPGLGIDGVIRGDEGFGIDPLHSEQHARACAGMVTLADFMDEATAEQLSDQQQRIPDGLKRREDESVATYRDRLYHSYRIPIGLAALNDVKAPFVEIASPMLSRRVMEFVREMPDQLRTDKSLFKQIAKSVSPPIPYATMGADDDKNDYLGSVSYTRWMAEELGTELAHRLFPAHFREAMLAGIRRAPSPLEPSRNLRAALKRIIPSSWVNTIRIYMGPFVPGYRLLSLRSSMICRMVRLLEEDSKLLGSTPIGYLEITLQNQK